MRKQGGFSLVEMMVAMLLIAVLLGLAVPGYRQYVMNSHRQAAHSFMLVLAESQERFFTENKTYASGLTDLGYASDTVSIDNSGQVVASGSSAAIYTISFVNPLTASYSTQAVPVNGQADDTDCGTLTLASDGTRTASGGGSDCW